LNKITRIYANVIFSIFRFGINLFYNSQSNDNQSEKNYDKMMKMKDSVYQIFNFLTSSLQKDQNEFLVKINFFKTKFFIRGLILSDVVMTSEAWEPYVKEVFKTKKSDVVIDVGAHIGTYCIPKAIEVGQEGKVIAFEPNPINIHVLKKNIFENHLENISLIEKAVSEKADNVKLSLSDDPMLSMITKESNQNTVDVETVPLDSLLEKFSLEKVNWLKIDAEGSEISVLKGAKKMISKFHPKIIVETREENEEEMKAFLEIEGYKIKFLGGEYFFAE